MQSRPRILPILGIFILVCLSWWALSGTMLLRSSSQEGALQGNIGDMWGKPQLQTAPEISLHWTTRVKKEIEVHDLKNGASQTKVQWEDSPSERALQPVSARIVTRISLDERRKGLVWFPLYTVDFSGRYRLPEVDLATLEAGAENIEIEVLARLPSGDGTYDAFELMLGGEDISRDVDRSGGALRYRIPVTDFQGAELTISYRSRGSASWKYHPLPSVGEAGLVEDFELDLYTDFLAIDFPAGSMSPTEKARSEGGWELNWSFERIMTGQNIGMVMPERVQPGELGAKLSASAPISLGFFTLVIYVLSFLRGHRIHPIHYAFVGASFFAFHLLFAYTADHLPVEWAFGLSSLTSMVLVISYLRLVISSRFAFGPVAVAQLVYQVGFGIAHFFDGFTGLAITVLGIATLFWLMQITARIDLFGPSEASFGRNDGEPEPVK